MNIGLLGFEFSSPNKGCEALSYSFLSLLRDIGLKDVHIINFNAASLGFVPDRFPEFSFSRVVPILKDKSCRFVRYLCKCDVVFDVTLGDSFSDIYSLQYYKSLIKQKRITEFFCKNYILLPQTYGPFINPESIILAEKVLHKTKKIYCRDSLSQQLLYKDFNISDSVLTSDLAFLLPYEKSVDLNDLSYRKIGLNVSGLLYKGGFYKDNQFELKLQYRDYIDQLINWIISSKDYQCFLIPHVVDLNNDSYDDDYKVSLQLCEKYQGLSIAPPFKDPIEAKSYISNMDYFIGSRMHSTIAAFSSGVITIPVSYSRKFEGLYNSLSYEFTINGKEYSTEQAVDKTIDYVLNSSALISSQKDSLMRINDLNQYLINSIRDDLCK